MNQLIASNFLCLQSALQISGLISASGKVGIYINNLVPDNSTGYGAFSQAVYAGYSAIPCAGKSKGTVLLANGVAQLGFGPFTFANGSGPSQFANGFLVFDSSLRVLCSQQFTAPIPLPAGSSVTFDVLIQVRGLNVACP